MPDPNLDVENESSLGDRLYVDGVLRTFAQVEHPSLGEPSGLIVRDEGSDSDRWFAITIGFTTLDGQSRYMTHLATRDEVDRMRKSGDYRDVVRKLIQRVDPSQFREKP